MVDLTDRSLVIRTLAGDTRAFGFLVQRYQSSVFSVCYRLMGERHEAEDMSQDTFIRAFQRLSTFDPGRAFGPWVRRVAANLCYNRLQKKSSTEVLLNDEFELTNNSERSNPERITEMVEQGESIRIALATLPPQYRIALELRHFHELSYEEMAVELGLPVNTVKSHLFRARKKMAELLKNP